MTLCCMAMSKSVSPALTVYVGRPWLDPPNGAEELGGAGPALATEGDGAEWRVRSQGALRETPTNPVPGRHRRIQCQERSASGLTDNPLASPLPPPCCMGLAAYDAMRKGSPTVFPEGRTGCEGIRARSEGRSTAPA